MNLKLIRRPFHFRNHTQPDSSAASPTKGVSTTLEPVLSIHGLGGLSANIRPVIEASGLVSTRKIITFDLEGHGLSPMSGNEESVVNYAESARAVLDVHVTENAVAIRDSMDLVIIRAFRASQARISATMLAAV